MRVFIAIQLPEAVKNKLYFLQNKLREDKENISWVNPSNIHLTLKFIGEITDNKLQEIIKGAESALQGSLQFNITIANLGVFPDPGHPRIIWAGIKEGNTEIIKLACALEESLERIGITREKREFFCHITLGRVKSLINTPGLTARIKELNNVLSNEDIAFEAKRITVFRSKLKSNGPVYEALKELNLKTT